MGFVRFVVTRRTEGHELRRGVIKAANELKKVVPSSVEEELTYLLTWFDENLPEPDRLFLSEADRDPAGNGVCWFKDSATEHIARLRPLVTILDEWGEDLEVLTTTQPGHVLYEDEFQVVAVPRSNTEG